MRTFAVTPSNSCVNTHRHKQSQVHTFSVCHTLLPWPSSHPSTEHKYICVFTNTHTHRATDEMRTRTHHSHTLRTDTYTNTYTMQALLHPSRGKRGTPHTCAHLQTSPHTLVQHLHTVGDMWRYGYTYSCTLTTCYQKQVRPHTCSHSHVKRVHTRASMHIRKQRVPRPLQYVHRNTHAHTRARAHSLLLSLPPPPPPCGEGPCEARAPAWGRGAPGFRPGAGPTQRRER